MANTSQISYKSTKTACYIGYITQAISINFSPLMFVKFSDEFSLSLSKLSLLIAFSFISQLLTDIIMARISDRINQRLCVIIAHFSVSAGLIGFATLPFIFTNHFAGLIIADILCGLGGGLIEVMVSPIIEACPSDKKSASMSLLHSFYCWGQAGVILFSTLFFLFCGIDSWRIVSCLWALIPASGGILFCFVPILPLIKDGDTQMGRKELFGSKIFIIMLTVMICSGAAELVMSQWASSFAERGLSLDKSLGDLCGPFIFAMLMGISRVFYTRMSEKIDLEKYMIVSSALCIVSYLLAALSPLPFLSLVGCGLCGLSVGIMWPGTLSMAAKRMPRGGYPMFALLAFGGDIGCIIGPTVAGWISDLVGGNLKIAFFFALIFPLTEIFAVIYLKAGGKNQNEKEQ